jgi:uncharacterized membrane protein YgcG
MNKGSKQKKVYRLADEQQGHSGLSFFQIFLRASVVFSFAFIMLCTFFVSAAILPKKVVILNVPRGASINIGMPTAKKDAIKLIEICRGALIPKCTVLAKNVPGVKKVIKIPVTYAMGNATIKISITNSVLGKTTKTPLADKKVKIIAVKTSGGGSGGGGGGSSGGGSSSSSSESTITLINGGVSTPTPTPVSTPSSGGTIIRATPTPTPSINNTTKPVLINH